MMIEVVRFARYKDTITGHLYIDSQLYCNTVENINSCLKPGVYVVERKLCKLYRHRELVLKVHGASDCKYCTGHSPELQNPNSKRACNCPMLSHGNGVHKRPDGRILVGDMVVPGCVINAKQKLEVLEERIRKQITSGNSITLEIEDGYHNWTPGHE